MSFVILLESQARAHEVMSANEFQPVQERSPLKSCCFCLFFSARSPLKSCFCFLFFASKGLVIHTVPNLQDRSRTSTFSALGARQRELEVLGRRQDVPPLEIQDQALDLRKRCKKKKRKHRASFFRGCSSADLTWFGDLNPWSLWRANGTPVRKLISSCKTHGAASKPLKLLREQSILSDASPILLRSHQHSLAAT